jgi:peptidoglycan/xylan/chitin deacetylase (PgdA/CDA1 family)
MTPHTQLPSHPDIWPEGVRSAVALTFDLDIETPFVGEDPAVVARPGFLSQARYTPRVAVPLILSLLEQLEINATFFIPGKSAEDFPESVRSIVAAGHEIAAHGYTHEAPSGMSREREDQELQRTLEILNGFGADVVGYRAPFFEASVNTVDLLHQQGLRYSSGMMDDIRPYRYPGTDVIELPSQWLLDDWSQFGHGSDDGLARNATCAHVRQLWIEEFQAIHELGGLFVLTMHPQVIGRPSRIRMLADLIAEMRAVEGVWMTTCRSIASHVSQEG